jgi:hypothetical protein
MINVLSPDRVSELRKIRNFFNDGKTYMPNDLPSANVNMIYHTALITMSVRFQHIISILANGYNKDECLILSNLTRHQYDISISKGTKIFKSKINDIKTGKKDWKIKIAGGEKFVDLATYIPNFELYNRDDYYNLNDVAAKFKTPVKPMKIVMVRGNISYIPEANGRMFLIKKTNLPLIEKHLIRMKFDEYLDSISIRIGRTVKPEDLLEL